MTVSFSHEVVADKDKDPEIVLNVKNLKVYYATPTGDVKAVDDVNFQVYQGEILGLVGESGCGKTTTAMAILRLVQPPGRIVGGQILLDGIDMAGLDKERLRDVRWNKLALIPQGAMNSLNPIMRINRQLGDAIETHDGKQPKAVLK
ncbi:MAG: ABC transporter ATP-binding protein, partial [Caldilineaceae bacterium]|nr:ABC transporter ATP-binding protein [Caldilineaceae bacterium]